MSWGRCLTRVAPTTVREDRHASEGRKRPPKAAEPPAPQEAPADERAETPDGSALTFTDFRLPDQVFKTQAAVTAGTWRELSKTADHAKRGRLLLEYADAFTDADYWTAVAEAWLDSERQVLTRDDWKGLWGSDRPGRREHAMTAEERDRVDGLDERVPVFRGVHGYNFIPGLSWTLDREKAAWFARRFDAPDWPGVVIAGMVRRERILALIEARQESEVVVLPRFVYARK